MRNGQDPPANTTTARTRGAALRDVGFAALGAGTGVLAAGVAWPISLLAAAGAAGAVAAIEKDRLTPPPSTLPDPARR